MIYLSALRWLAEERITTKGDYLSDQKRASTGPLSRVRRAHMNNEVPKYVTRERAALLLGIPEEELSRISGESELGHTERAGDQEETFFTYEELRQICLLSTHGSMHATY